MLLVRSYRTAAAALAVALIASACSSGSNAIPSKSSLDQTSSASALQTKALPKKSLTVTYTPLVVVPAGASAPLGIKQWAFYGWSDNKTISAIGLNASGGIAWESDVANDNSGNLQSIQTNLGTTIVRPTSTSPTVSVYSKNATDVAVAIALRTDMEGYAGYGGSGGKPGGPQPTSLTRSTNSANGGVLVSAGIFSLDLAEVIVTVGEAGTLAAIGPIGWLILAGEAGAMIYEMVQANKENQAPAGAAPGGLGGSGGGGGGGPYPGDLVKICWTDHTGTMTCEYAFY
jgi:hypothetical protein